MVQPQLTGIKVVDLTSVVFGPYCTQILADLGAEVIKVENPKGGDDTRGWGPPYAAGESAYYLCANRNKKSVAIDLSCAEGQSAVKALAATSDVLVENYKLGGLDKYGLDYASLSAQFPAHGMFTFSLNITEFPWSCTPITLQKNSSRGSIT